MQWSRSNLFQWLRMNEILKLTRRLSSLALNNYSYSTSLVITDSLALGCSSEMQIRFCSGNCQSSALIWRVHAITACNWHYDAQTRVYTPLSRWRAGEASPSTSARSPDQSQRRTTTINLPRTLVRRLLVDKENACAMKPTIFGELN